MIVMYYVYRILNIYWFSSPGVASQGKEVSKAGPKVDTGAAASLDYADIPHTQIRKVLYITKFVLSASYPSFFFVNQFSVHQLFLSALHVYHTFNFSDHNHV